MTESTVSRLASRALHLARELPAFEGCTYDFNVYESGDCVVVFAYAGRVDRRGHGVYLGAVVTPEHEWTFDDYSPGAGRGEGDFATELASLADHYGAPEYESPFMMACVIDEEIENEDIAMFNLV